MRFSIIIPAYNAERFIVRSVMSVINQSFNDFEIIVINDGSKDGTVSELKKINDPRLKIISKNNEGVSATRNRGIKEAKGDYICFLDADDEYYSNHLSILSDAINKYPDSKILATLNSICLLSGEIIMPKFDNSIYVSFNAVNDVLHDIVSVWTGCMCIKKDSFEKYGYFEEGIRYGEDRDMWERIYVHYPLIQIKTVTVKRNRDGSEATRSYKRNWNEINREERLKKYLNDLEINEDIKDSLITSNEWYKLSNVRTQIIFGNKKEGRRQYKKIDKRRIPFKRKFQTIISFFVPSFVLKYYFKKKYKGYYSS